MKGKGRGGKIPQGAHKGKVQFQGKKIKFDEEGGEDDTKTGMSFCALDAASLVVHGATSRKSTHVSYTCSRFRPTLLYFCPVSVSVK